MKSGKNISKNFIGDTDNDSKKEILGFTYSADSLFLNISELGTIERNTRSNVEKYFIEFPERNRRWTGVSSCRFFDLDNDGKNEFIFSLVSHYNNSVRSAIMIFDSANTQIRSSKVIADQYYKLQFVDVDGDGVKEILADGQIAQEKGSSEVALNTGNPYLKILDNELNFKYPPIRFKKGQTNTIFLNENRGVTLFTLSNRALIEIPQSILYKLNFRGKIIDSLKIDVEKRANICYVDTTGSGNILVFTEK